MQDYDESSTGDLNPTQIYSLYERGYNYKFVKEQKQNGRTVEVVDLTPNTAKSAIATVQISVDKADKAIRSWAIIGKDGKRTTYTITKFVPNVDAPDSLFVFNKAKHPGVEVVDLR